MYIHIHTQIYVYVYIYVCIHMWSMYILKNLHKEFEHLYVK